MTRTLWTVPAAVVLVVGMSLGVAVVGMAMFTPVLVVTDETGAETLTVPVASGDEVAIEYTHSVEQTLVTDVYVVSEGALVSERMLFSSFGWGLPADAEVTRVGDRYAYDPPRQRYDPLVVTTGPVAGHELVVDGQRYDLVDIAEKGTVSVRIERRLGV